MRVALAAGLILPLVASAAIGQTRPDETAGAATRAHTPATLRYLNERIGVVAFQEAPVDQVLDWLTELTPMNVVVRWEVLESAGLARDKPISLDVRNLRLAQVLWLVLDAAGGTDLKLAYWASDELLLISTEEDLGRGMLTRVYDVSDLLISVQDFPNCPQVNPAGTSGGGGQGGSRAVIAPRSSGGIPSERTPQRGQAGNPDMETLIKLIIETIEPDSWVVNGGRGTIQAFGDLLVVRNSILAHQALGGHLQQND